MECWILNALYIILSATLVFLPLTTVVPNWIKLIPFYRKSMRAIDKIFESEEELEILFPEHTEKLKFKGSII